MKKIIFNKLILDVTKFFLLSSMSLSLIILVVQAVNFLDYISEDGHGIYTYFGITMLNFPKIFSRKLVTKNRLPSLRSIVPWWNTVEERFIEENKMIVK